VNAPATLPSLGQLLRTEVRLLLSRGSARAALAVALVVGIVPVLAGLKMQGMGPGGPSLNGVPVNQLVQLDGVTVAGWALQGRNFFVLPLFLVLATAASFAEDLHDRTLREVLLRPLSRVDLLVARWGALAALSAATLLLTCVPSLALGLALFGMPAFGQPEVVDVVGGYAASFLSDLGLLALTTLVALFLKNAGSVVASLILILGLDMGVRLVLKGLKMLGMESATALVPWTFGDALACWEGWKDAWSIQQLLAVLAWTAALALLSSVRLRRMDVP
jgi:ABC-type transport system involved in multi-copper enzyme maturation permease subunit